MARRLPNNRQLKWREPVGPAEFERTKRVPPVFDFQGTSMIGARRKANFWPVGSSTDTWQVYRPGASLASGTLNFNGSALDLGSSPSVIWRGAVSNAFTLPFMKLTLAT